MDWTLIFALTSAVGWIVSSFFWLWAAALKLPIDLPDNNEGDGNFSVGDDGLFVHGYAVPTAREIKIYIKKARFRNSSAALLSGISAFLSALAIYFANAT
ncbi:MAG: hypothetical protein L3J21_10545 [Devosiaceae bacterium]|nr:hypothetical protein [Devosiaceae bacterium]